MSSRRSLACHTNCDTGHPFIICRAFGSGAVTTCIYDLGLSRLGSKHQTFRMRGQRSNRLQHRGSSPLVKDMEFHLKILQVDFFHRRMICTAFDRNWPCDSFEEDFKF